MTSLTNHLIRRGVEEVHTTFVATRIDGGKQFHFPAWGVGIIIGTVLAFAFGHFAISYTYGEVVALLAAVEAPSSTVIVRTPPEDNKSEEADAPLLLNDEKVVQNADQEILLVRQRALTSRFCTIKRHLRARGGRGARFRGFGVYLVIFLAYSALVGVITSVIPRPGLTLVIAESLAYTALTPLSLLLNHVILSEPSSKSAFQRLAPREVVKKAVLPTFLFAFFINATAQGLLYAFLQIYLMQSSTSINALGRHVGPLAIIIVLTMLFSLCFHIPAAIAITRVRASLLSTEETPIIPFDRTFNGKVVPTEQGGSGMLNLWQALTSCDVQTFLRVVGVHANVLAMQIFLSLFGIGVVLLELRLIGGPKFMAALAANVAFVM